MTKYQRSQFKEYVEKVNTLLETLSLDDDLVHLVPSGLEELNDVMRYLTEDKPNDY